ncbi:hypothetical protein [Microbulbifer sp. TYP-18]|uniref:hypothetical protein n=1 Tax=Microbulbifer sp. TYP-18 TaxID=3230024 RepID=UPI0034C62B49
MGQVYVNSNQVTLFSAWTTRGGVILPNESNLSDGDQFYYRFNSKVIRKKSPIVKQFTTEVIRIKDKKILGKKIEFGRIGGDTPTGILHPSSYGCSEMEGFDNDLFNAVVKLKSQL